jgi:hypothetical protein
MPQPQNVIGIIYDFDNTLSPRAMQEDAIFPYLNVQPGQFWGQVSVLVNTRAYENELAWMRLLLEHEPFRALGNEGLRGMGERLTYYPGVPEIFKQIEREVEGKQYHHLDISIEHYVITSGLREVLQGSVIRPLVKEVFGSEFDEEDNGHLSFPKRVVGHTQKTQYLFRINKGYLDLGKDVNDQVPKEERRIPFENLVYIGDGPTDVPCFAVMSENGGRTVAVYDPVKPSSFESGMQLRKAHRVDELAEADYREGSHLRRVLGYMIREIADQILYKEQRQIGERVIPAPRHG